jgi:hypothetical protein
MRGVVAGTGKRLDGAGQRIASLLARMWPSCRISDSRSCRACVAALLRVSSSLGVMSPSLWKSGKLGKTHHKARHGSLSICRGASIPTGRFDCHLKGWIQEFQFQPCLDDYACSPPAQRRVVLLLEFRAQESQCSVIQLPRMMWPASLRLPGQTSGPLRATRIYPGYDLAY